jgi:pimeloyl-ACP methyl ester carboxylesterase
VVKVNNYLTSEEIEPFFFGTANRKLFGCCHFQNPEQPKKGMILICQTIGQEYIHGHRACYQLAERLAASGYAVLRFDYFGCGDSDGNFEEGGMRQWIADILSAADEMHARFGSGEVCLIGYRMGATLAIEAAGSISGIHALVLWEPIFKGSEYLSELAERQFTFCKSFKCRITSSPEDPSLPTEILGFSLMPNLIREIKAVHLTRDNLPAACRSLTIFNRRRHTVDSEPEIPAAECRHEVKYIADHRLWEEELYKRLIPVKTLETIAGWVERIIP